MGSLGKISKVVAGKKIKKNKEQKKAAEAAAATIQDSYSVTGIKPPDPTGGPIGRRKRRPRTSGPELGGVRSPLSPR